MIHLEPDEAVRVAACVSTSYLEEERLRNREKGKHDDDDDDFSSIVQQMVYWRALQSKVML